MLYKAWGNGHLYLIPDFKVMFITGLPYIAFIIKDDVWDFVKVLFSINWDYYAIPVFTSICVLTVTVLNTSCTLQSNQLCYGVGPFKCISWTSVARIYWESLYICSVRGSSFSPWIFSICVFLVHVEWCLSGAQFISGISFVPRYFLVPHTLGGGHEEQVSKHWFLVGCLPLATEMNSFQSAEQLIKECSSDWLAGWNEPLP